MKKMVPALTDRQRYWLEQARFKWPRQAHDEVITLIGQQLNWLLDGSDIMRMQAHEILQYHIVL